MVILNLRAVGVASWLSALYEPIFLTKILPRCYIPCVDGWLQILVVGLHSTIEESLRNILRKSVSKVSRRYFIQGTTLVGVCRDAEMIPKKLVLISAGDTKDDNSATNPFDDARLWNTREQKTAGIKSSLKGILEWLVIKTVYSIAINFELHPG